MSARVRVFLGLIGSVLMLFSSIPHSLLGWPAQRQILLTSHVLPDTILGLSVGRHFGGLAMVVFGLITVVSFVQVMRGHAPHMRATTIIGFAYTGFGLWTWFVTREAFALVFIVPGLLVLTGATAPRR